jgi:hypothetical protein
MRTPLHVVAIVLVGFAATHFSEGADDHSAPLSVNICDLVKTPEKYAGKMISVHGQVGWGWRHDEKLISEFGIRESSCMAELTVMFPDAVQPKPAFDIGKDEHFQTLEQGLHKGMAIEGTFEGLFEQSEKGYGRKHKTKMRLVLERVSDIFAVPFSRPK